MYFLLLSIFSSTLLLIIFKLFEYFKIRTFQAIVANYITAAIFGFSLSNSFSVASLVSSSWFTFTLILGVLFISLFYLMALTAQKSGVSVSSVANKMSVIIPIIFSFFLYHERIGSIKILGVFLALVGVFLVSFKNAENKLNNKYFYLAILLFFGSGLLDTLIKYAQHLYQGDNNFNLFVPTIFSVAGILGLFIMLYRMFFLDEKININSLLGGVILGVCNYASIFYLIKTLEIKNLESSVVFPLNNIGVVVCSCLASFLFFKEKMSRKNWIGILLSVIAIGLISFDYL